MDKDIDELIRYMNAHELNREDLETERAKRLMRDFLIIRNNKYNSTNDINNPIARGIIENAFTGYNNDTRLLDESMVLLAIQCLEDTLILLEQTTIEHHKTSSTFLKQLQVTFLALHGAIQKELISLVKEGYIYDDNESTRLNCINFLKSLNEREQIALDVLIKNKLVMSKKDLK